MVKLPKRYTPTGVGKYIGGSVYIHRQYAHLLPELATVLDKMRNGGNDFTLIKYNFKTKSFTLIRCDDFNTAHEPTMGIALRIYLRDGIYVTSWIYPPADPWIYHHKWLMVGDDYTGFDVEESKARSMQWMSLPHVNKSQIGKKSYWETHVLPRLN